MTVQKTLKIMPLQFAPNIGDSNEELITRDKLDVTIQLEVDAEAAKSLLPTWKGSDGKTYGYRPLPMGPTGKPILLVNYTQERDVDYMAGGGYNELEFYLSSEFVGENAWDFQGAEYNGAYGMFAVLLLPSDLIPLLLGREIMGTPKHLANVTDLILEKMFADDEAKSGWFEVQNKNGGAFIAGCLRNIEAIPYEALDEPLPEHTPLPALEGWGQATNVEPGFKVMLWKHIPAADWARDLADVSYNIAVTLGGEKGELSQPMAGDGNIVFPNLLDAHVHPNFSLAYEAIRNLVEQNSFVFPGNVLIRHYGNAYRAEDIHITDGPRMPGA